MSHTSLHNVDAAARWLTTWVTGTLRTDSRLVQHGDAFIAWPGAVHDGRDHVASALARGAATCLVEAEGAEAFGFTDPRIASLPGLKAATGVLADRFFRHPSGALRVVATTGTNGKTSTAWWTAQALSRLGQRCGVIGTLGVGQPPEAGQEGLGQMQATGLTTPDPVVLQAGLRAMADQGLAACAMEASSIGIVEERMAGTAVEVALYTNFTRDHLDYHGDMEAYWAAKRRLFAWPGLKAAVINVDDPQGAGLVAELAGRGPALWTVSMVAEARLWVRDLVHQPQGLAFTLVESGTQIPVQTRLIGEFNAANLLLVIGGLRALGVPLVDAARAAAQVSPVPGRMQRVAATGAVGVPEVVVDYAHTPDALDKALCALRPLAQARGGALWCVFGCGGNRDSTKRPMMGGIAARLADRVVVTSDNPRQEPPESILDQILAGVPHEHAGKSVHVQADRRLAILGAVAAAQPADVVLVAGKGHEDYQEIAGVRHPFSDVTVASAALAARSAP